MRNRNKDRVDGKRIKFLLSQVCWYVPVIPAIWEVKAGVPIRSFRPAQANLARPFSITK
jgi:hypothetical protein